MRSFDRFIWTGKSVEKQLAMARKLSDRQLRALAVRYDWQNNPDPVLS